MKQTIKVNACLCAVAMMGLVSGCQVSVTPGTVAVATPAVVVAPEFYVWDGVEFVGEYNGEFRYCNPAGVWVVCDPVILARFQVWERGHPDWRAHAIRNAGAHRIDRDHRPAEAQRHVAPERKTVAAGQKKATTPQKGKEEEKRDER